MLHIVVVMFVHPLVFNRLVEYQGTGAHEFVLVHSSQTVSLFIGTQRII